MIGSWAGTTTMSLVLLQVPQTSPGRMTPEQEFQIAMEALRQQDPPGVAILALLVPFALFAMILGIVWLAYRNRQAKMRAQADFHRQLLDKFGSGREFAEFLESKGSQRFLEELWSQRAGRYDYVLRTMRTGIIMTMLGFGMLALSWMNPRFPPGILALIGGFHIPGVLLLVLGVGLLISAGISRRLSKQWEEKAETASPQDS